jgi:hypoxanthine phosphoribosyltransferase
MITEIQGRTLKRVIPEKAIKMKVAELGRQITDDYTGKAPILVGILKGAFVFLSDLMRHIDLSVQIDFIRISTYKSGMKPGEIDLIMDISMPISDRHVILVEDIVDTGITLKFISDRILERNPESYRICALIDLKHRRGVDVKLDYVGFELEEGFLVGYGLDMGEQGRNLPSIYNID